MTKTPSPLLDKTPSPTLSVEEFATPTGEERATYKTHSKTPKSAERHRQWVDLLEGNLCIGENHQEISAKKFLIQNMPRFKEAGYSVLFMEHLSEREHQYLIDNYFESSPEVEMPEELNSYLTRLNSGHMDDYDASSDYIKEARKYNFKTIVQAAKAAGIKVVCLEESVSAYKAQTKRDRAIAFNDRVKNVVEEEEKKSAGLEKELKWLAFVGVTHLNEFYLGVPGICEIVEEVQDLAIIDSREEVKITSTPTKQKFALESSFSADGFCASIILQSSFTADLNYTPELENSADARPNNITREIVAGRAFRPKFIEESKGRE